MTITVIFICVGMLSMTITTILKIWGTLIMTIPLLAIDPVRINKKNFDRNEHERIL